MASLKVEKREGSKKYLAFELRKEGFIPAIVYSKDETHKVKVEEKALEQVLHAGDRIVDLDIEGTSKRVVIKDVQFGMTHKDIMHCDFRVIGPDTRVKLPVPVKIKGRAKGQEIGGVVEQRLFTIEVECLPQDLPESIVADVKPIRAGHVMFVHQLTPPEGVRFATAGNVAVVACKLPRGMTKAQATAAVKALEEAKAEAAAEA